MAIRTGKAGFGTLFLVTVIGLLLGGFFSVIIETILHALGDGSGNVVSVFITPVTLGVPLSIGYPEPLALDLGAVKGQIGFQLNINAMSFLGLWLAHKFYKSHQ